MSDRCIMYSVFCRDIIISGRWLSAVSMPHQRLLCWPNINPYSAEIYFSRQVCRRQILTTKVDPRTVRVKIFLMVVDP